MGNYKIIIIELCVACAILFGYAIWISIKHASDKRAISALSRAQQKLENENVAMTSEYSEKVLTYIRTFTAQITVLIMREFLDGHDVSKVSKSQVESIIKEIAEKVHGMINLKPVIFTRTLFTADFLDLYIVQLVVQNVKTLWDKAINQGG